MILRHLMTDAGTHCNNSDPTSSLCGEDVHSVGLSLKALSLGIIFIVSMVMNGTVCLVFYKKTQLLSVSNTFVLNLICCQLGKFIFNTFVLNLICCQLGKFISNTFVLNLMCCQLGMFISNTNALNLICCQLGILISYIFFLK